MHARKHEFSMQAAARTVVHNADQSNVIYMPRVIPRQRGTPRPDYLPTSIEARLNDPRSPNPLPDNPNVLPRPLPSNLTDYERDRLRKRGISMDFLDRDTTRVIKLKIIGQLDTSDPKPMPIYKPDDYTPTTTY